MCFSSNSFSISVLTKGWKLIGTRRPFWCVAVKIFWNADLTECFNDLPIREIKTGNLIAICFSIKHWFWSTFETCLVCVSDSPSCERRFRPIIGLWPSSTTVTLTFVATQPLHSTDVLITPIILINSMENVYSSCFSGVCTQKLSWPFDTTASARLSLMIVQTLPESTNAFVSKCPMLTFIGSTSLILSVSEIRATFLSSNLS